MPMLSNSRHEAFAHAVARGLTVDAAYVEAGYAANSGNASRLNGTDRVAARVVELKSQVQKMQERSTRGVVLTKEWILEQLIDVVFLAKQQEKPDLAGANKALNLLGLELGMYVERKEVGKPGEFDGLTIAGKRDRIKAIAQQLGLDRISAADRLGLQRDGQLIEHEAED